MSSLQINDRAEAKVLQITNTQHMCHFVHQFYVANMATMRARYEAAMNHTRAKVSRNEFGYSIPLPQ